MDYRLRRLVILCALLMVSAIVATVLLINVRQTNSARDAALKKQEEDQALARTDGAVGEDFYAYLQDEAFFDPDQSDQDRIAQNSLERLSMVATSVERDVRVQIMDESGSLAAGRDDLFITLDGVPYKDLDRDGIVYVGDLSPGDYQVGIQPGEGYRVPSNPLSIKVKDRVEYLPISDISLLIKTEADIDAALEDTGDEVDGEENVDDSRRDDIRPQDGGSVFGIDVSKWNKDIDWKRVKAAGVDFAIIRCGYRGSKSGTLVEDPYFRQNLAGARAAGVEVGLYFFTQATNEVEAVEEASMSLALNGGTALEYPIFIDVEGAGGNGRADRLDVVRRTDVAAAFCSTIEGAGYKAGVYSSRSWFYNNLDMSRLDKHFVWLAEYRDSPLYKGKYNMWQYTSKGTIDGISTLVDFDISYR